MIARHLGHERRGGDRRAAARPPSRRSPPAVDPDAAGCRPEAPRPDRDALGLHHGGQWRRLNAVAQRPPSCPPASMTAGFHVLHRPRHGRAGVTSHGHAPRGRSGLTCFESFSPAMRGRPRASTTAPTAERPRQGPASHLVQPDHHAARRAPRPAPARRRTAPASRARLRRPRPRVRRRAASTAARTPLRVSATSDRSSTANARRARPPAASAGSPRPSAPCLSCRLLPSSSPCPRPPHAFPP